MDEIRDQIREKVRRITEDLGWSLSKIAREAGMSHTTLTRFMNNDDAKWALSTPTLRKLEALAKRVAGEIAHHSLSSSSALDPTLSLLEKEASSGVEDFGELIKNPEMRAWLRVLSAMHPDDRVLLGQLLLRWVVRPH